MQKLKLKQKEAKIIAETVPIPQPTASVLPPVGLPQIGLPNIGSRGGNFEMDKEYLKKA